MVLCGVVEPSGTYSKSSGSLLPSLSLIPGSTASQNNKIPHVVGSLFTRVASTLKESDGTLVGQGKTCMTQHTNLDSVQFQYTVARPAGC